MKIQLVNDPSVGIEGYTLVNYAKDGLNFLDTLSNNECEEIIANDILYHIPHTNVGDILQKFVSKLRFNGKLVLGGCDLRTFCRSVINNIISEPEALQLLQSTRSMIPCAVVTNYLNTLGLTIHSSIINGPIYEITAIRHKN